MKKYFVYILTDTQHRVLYTGVTNNLYRRISEHKNHTGSSFVKKYHLSKLVYYEETYDIFSALSREKQTKAGSRIRKINLINNVNTDWNDLSKTVGF